MGEVHSDVKSHLLSKPIKHTTMTRKENDFYPDVPSATKPRISKEFYDEYGTRLYRDDLGRLFDAEVFDRVWNCAYTFKMQGKRFKGANNNTLVAITHNQI